LASCSSKIYIGYRGTKAIFASGVAVERFWRSLKYEEVYLKDYIDLIEARKEIGSYISRYNEFRPHQSLAGRTPDMVYAEGRRENAA